MAIQCSIVIPAVDEKEIKSVIGMVYNTCRREDIAEILIVTGPLSNDAYLQFLQGLQTDFPEFRLKQLRQPGNGVGDAIFFGFSQACGTHVISIAADLENDPNDVAVMIEAAKKDPDAVITASRRLQAGSFAAYPAVKKLFNNAFQFF